MTDIPDTGSINETYIQRETRPEHAYPDGPRSVMGLYSWFRFGYIAFISVTTVLGLLSLMVFIAPEMFSVYVDEYSYDFTPADLVMTGVSMAYIPVFIFCIVMTCRMTYRTMRNLHTVGSQHVKNSPTMSVVYYFIPFVNLVMPANATSDIYRGTMKATDGIIKDGRITLWWSCWIISSIAERVSLQLGYTIESTVLSLVGIALSIVAAYALLRLFRDIARAQEDLKYGGIASVFD